MKNIDTIEQFISLRAAGLTYKEITKKINVSRPTLVKWNNEYRYAIELAEKDLFTTLFTKTLIDNEDHIVHNVNLLKRYEFLDEKTPWANEVVERAQDRLTKIFLNKVENINMKFSKEGEIREVQFTFRIPYSERTDYER